MYTISRQARAGFTLTEILIAIAIVAIMAAVAIPTMFSYIKSSRIDATKTQIRILDGAIQKFETDIGQYPETLDDLTRKPGNEELARDWQGPYVGKGKPLPKDPWKNAYQYRPTPGEEHPYELYSYGPKGKSAPQAEWISAWNL